MTTRPIRPYVQPKTAHHQFQFARALGILQGRQDGETFVQLARQYGITAQRVSQICQQVMVRGGMPYLTGNIKKNGL